MERSTKNRAIEKKGIYDAEQDKPQKSFVNTLKQNPMKAVLTVVFYLILTIVS